MEDLWCALCTWPQNIRVTINYLSRMTSVMGNMSLMLQHAKRIIVCFSRSQARCIVHELINDLSVSHLDVMCVRVIIISAHRVVDQLKLI